MSSSRILAMASRASHQTGPRSAARPSTENLLRRYQSTIATGSGPADPSYSSAPGVLASSHYLAPSEASSVDPLPSAATTGTPENLSAQERRTIERIIRVDQAGELGANWIYRGQLAVMRNRKDVAELIQEMWDTEKKHIETFDKIVKQHRVRPTALYPLWKVAGFTLGAGTALMGREAAMACTEAVETVIGEHYADQIKAMSSINSSHPSLPLLTRILAEFRDDELDHLDTAIEHDSQKAPAHSLLSSVIAVGCRAAIFASERI